MKPIFLIFGNCQAIGLFFYLTHQPDLQSEMELCYLPSDAVLGDMMLSADKISRCKLVWEQVGVHQSLPFRDQLPADAKIVRFSELSFPPLWPFLCTDPRNKPMPPDLPWGPYPYGDRIALAVAEEAVEAGMAWETYLERGRRQMPNLPRLLDLEAARMKVKSRNTDVDLSELVFKNWRTQRLFATFNHPSNSLIALLGEMLMQASQPALACVDEAGLAAARAAVLAPAKGEPDFDSFQMPTHPAVAEIFDLGWCQDDTLYRHYQFGQFTRDQFMRRYISFSTEMPPQ